MAHAVGVNLMGHSLQLPMSSCMHHEESSLGQHRPPALIRLHHPHHLHLHLQACATPWWARTMMAPICRTPPSAQEVPKIAAAIALPLPVVWVTRGFMTTMNVG